MGNALNPIYDVWSTRPAQEDLIDSRVDKRQPFDQVNATHWKRVIVLGVCEAALIILLFVPLTFVHVFTTHGGSRFTPSLFALAGLSMACYGRYKCMFRPEWPWGGLLWTSHASCGLLMSMAWVAEGEMLRSTAYYFFVAFVSGIVAGMYGAWEFVSRGQQSAAGDGIFRRPLPEGASPLIRGYDAALFDTSLLTSGHAPHLPSRYAACLFPSLPPLPPTADPRASAPAKLLIRCLEGARVLLRLTEAWSAFTHAALVVLTVGAVARVLPLENMTEHAWQGNLSSDWAAIASVAFWSAFLTLYGLKATTALMYHIMLQPLDFGIYPSLPDNVLKHWLNRGWGLVLRRHEDDRPRLVARELDEWRKDLEEQRRFVAQALALADCAVFPPCLDAHNTRQTVMGKLYRALAFQDLAVAARLVAGRRKWIYYDLKLWQGYFQPISAVVNSFTLQLELIIEAATRVEGGTTAPLGSVYKRVGVPEPRDADSMARLLIDAEVQRRLEAILREKQLNREPIQPLPQVPLLPKKANAWWWAEDTLQPVPMATIDVQTVENAVEALGDLYENAVKLESGPLRNFEDPRSSAKTTLPSALSMLISCQLAIHIYSSQVFGGKRTGFDARIRDRRSVVHPKLLRASQAVDHAIEQILYRFYEGDLQLFTFPPLYAKCVGVYVQRLQSRGAR